MKVNVIVKDGVAVMQVGDEEPFEMSAEYLHRLARRVKATEHVPTFQAVWSPLSLEEAAKQSPYQYRVVENPDGSLSMIPMGPGNEASAT